MSNLNILIVEGNLREENQNFSEVGIQTHTESLKDSLSHFTYNLNFDVVYKKDSLTPRKSKKYRFYWLILN